MALNSTICGIVHQACGPEFIARPWFRVLNFYQGQSAYPGFAASIIAAMHLIEVHKL